jgi:hypothetical protein
MKAVLFLAILVVLSSCASPINPWPEDPTLAPNLDVYYPQTVLVYEPFTIQTTTSSNSRSPKPIAIEWKWVEGEVRYPATDTVIVREGIPSLKSVSFYGTNSGRHDALLSLEISGISSRSDSPMSYALNIQFDPPLPRTEELATIETFFGNQYHLGNVNGELVLMGINNHRTYEIPDTFSTWSNGVLVNGRISGYEREKVNTICSDKNQAVIQIDDQMRSVKEDYSYVFSSPSVNVHYYPSLITYTTIPIKTGTIVLEFDDVSGSIPVRVELGETQSVFISGVELQVKLISVGCIPLEQTITPAKISFIVDNQVINRSVGEIISSSNGAILVKDFYYYEYPTEGAAVYLAFNPERIVANNEGLFKGYSEAGQWKYTPLLIDSEVSEVNGAIAGLRIIYPPNFILYDGVFGTFIARHDQNSREIVVKDSSTVQVMQEGNNFVAYVKQKGIYNFEVTATENGVSTRKMVRIYAV